MNHAELNSTSSRSSLSVSTGHRIFYTIPEKPNNDNSEIPVDHLNNNDEDETNIVKSDNSKETYKELFSYIERNIIGRDKGFKGPFGDRLILYCDYTASGRSLKFIEEFIYNEVLPEYANTHTTNTVTSLQTTMFRHEARDIIRNSCQASDKDAVIFTGSGCTGAIHKLIHNLNLIKPPIVIVGPFEHHSNLLPWRHLAHSIHRIRINKTGELDPDHLESVLKDQSKLAVEENRPLIGAFAAVSNVTGVISDVDSISAQMHRYHGIVFWDYATGAPYLPIDMNPIITGVDRDYVYKDAVYFSMHKFIGGVQSPGVLIAKKSLFAAGEICPEGTGGGTVFFVRRENQIYLKDCEEREEGGTPDILGSIRAGLAFQLKDAATTDAIMKREDYLVKLSWSKFRDSSSNLIILGGSELYRLPIFSFLIRYEIRPNEYLFLHHNFVCSLLNDLFGIQSRSGCACAGPYAMDLLGINEDMARKLENVLVGSGSDETILAKYFDYPHREIIRPGFVRVNFPYYMPDSEITFILDAIKFVSKHGFKFLPLYKFNSVTSDWRHQEYEIFKERKWLSHISYKRGYMTWRRPTTRTNIKYPVNFKDLMKEAINSMNHIIKSPIDIPDESVAFDQDTKELRWFLLPSEVATILWNVPRKANLSKALFTPGSITEVFIGHDEKITNKVDIFVVEPPSNEVVEQFKETYERNLFENTNQNAYNFLIGGLSGDQILKTEYLYFGYKIENLHDTDSENFDKYNFNNSVNELIVKDQDGSKICKPIGYARNISHQNNSHYKKKPIF